MCTQHSLLKYTKHYKLSNRFNMNFRTCLHVDVAQGRRGASERQRNVNLIQKHNFK